jgi:hypothetical protein
MRMLLATSPNFSYKKSEKCVKISLEYKDSTVLPALKKDVWRFHLG